MKNKNGKQRPDGNKPRRLGNALDALTPDELITKRQLARYLDGELVTNPGGFTNIDANNAIKIMTPSGPIYLALLIFP